MGRLAASLCSRKVCRATLLLLMPLLVACISIPMPPDMDEN